MSSDIVVAKNSFSTETNGVPRAVTKGETFREGHPVVEGREELFEPFKVDNDIEQATASPGEKRRGRRKDTSEKKGQSQATASPGESTEGDADAKGATGRTADAAK